MIPSQYRKTQQTYTRLHRAGLGTLKGLLLDKVATGPRHRLQKAQKWFCPEMLSRLSTPTTPALPYQLLRSAHTVRYRPFQRPTRCAITPGGPPPVSDREAQREAQHPPSAKPVVSTILLDQHPISDVQYMSASGVYISFTATGVTQHRGALFTVRVHYMHEGTSVADLLVRGIIASSSLHSDYADFAQAAVDARRSVGAQLSQACKNQWAHLMAEVMPQERVCCSSSAGLFDKPHSLAAWLQSCVPGLCASKSSRLAPPKHSACVHLAVIAF